MKRILMGLLLWLWVISVWGAAQPVDLSAEREFGFGVQWTGEVFGVSLRYWFDPAVAAELDVVFLPGWVANIAVRGLMKPRLDGWAFDTPQTDFYLGFGLGLLDIGDEESTFYAQGVAGIEANRSRTEAWNLEFGVDYLGKFIAEETQRLTAVTLGLGIHLYPESM